ncbi:MAG: LysR family transcriptional regulator [SAR86 cluster bacterium]|uniref:LysR family transcriptional regulator n=1 Tax=SAR86 cluster bacterium TaxID=2030880 RepID=A0A2A4MSF6_9GAMM|nr:MAG: LysR family transcriptional regulator [SAR86 cluster bacterium]
MKFTLRQLQVFLAVARNENVTKAATQLAMSQSAASTSLKEFEQRFDVRLFDRIGKHLQLNELGKQIRPKAEALLSQAEEFELQLNQQDTVARLKVGATLTIGNYLAIGIIAKYMKKYPGSQVELLVENTVAIAQRIKNFEVDIGLIEGELQDPDLELSQWRDDELTPFCSPQHPLAKLQQLDDNHLTEIEWILREPGSGTRQAFDRAMGSLLSQLNIRLQLQHTEGIKRAVEAGLGVGCLSRISLVDAFKRGSLVPLSAPGKNWNRKFYFISHRNKFRSSAIKNWIELCQSY